VSSDQEGRTPSSARRARAGRGSTPRLGGRGRPPLLSTIHYLDSLQGSGIRPGLARIRAMLRALGHPERRYESIIVAGTNGKGSTSSMIASILRESGKRVGLYTSPHLVDIRERWMIDGAMISEELLEESVIADLSHERFLLGLPGKFEATQNVQTKRGARTITIDPKSHTLYLPTNESFFCLF